MGLFDIDDEKLKALYHRAELEANRGYVSTRDYPYLDKALFIYAKEHNCLQMNGKMILMTGRMLTSTGRRAGRLRYETRWLRNATICVDMSKLLLYNKTTIQVDKRL